MGGGQNATAMRVPSDPLALTRNSFVVFAKVLCEGISTKEFLGTA
jgi:hypothetical protein